MDHFQRLEGQLRLLFSRPSENIEYVLYQALEEAKPLFLTFLDIPPRSSAEKAEVESGKFSLRGGASIVNDEFKQQTLLLAQDLNASERLCAQLLEHAVRASPNRGGADAREAAVYSLHAERAALLACVRLVIEEAIRTDVPESRSLVILRKFAYDLIQGPFDFGRGKPKGSLAAKLLNEIDNIQDLIAKLRSSVRNPTSNNPALASTSQSALSGHNLTSTTMEARIVLLQEERRQLGHIMYLIAASGQLRAREVTSLVRWLSLVKDLSDGLTLYTLTSFFASINPAMDVPSESEEPSIYTDRELFVDVNALVHSSAWGLPSLRASLLLQWSIFVLEVRSRDPNLLGDYVVVEDEVASMAKKAIHADAFQALTAFVLRSRGHGAQDDSSEYHLAPDDSVIVGKSPHLDRSEHQDFVDSDFRRYLILSVETLIIALIRRMSRVLRDIRKQEEDFAFSTTRAARNLGSSVGATETPKPPRYDTETFFRLIAILYDELPLDASIKFWSDDDGGRLLPFLRWAAESRQSGMTVGMYDMFSSLAKGSSCAAYTYNFLSTGGGQYAASSDDAAYSASSACSWSTLFMALHHYESKMPNSRIVAPVNQATANGSQPAPSLSSDYPKFALHPEEIVMLSSFLRLLRNVARYSFTARVALYENPDFRAVQSLFNLTAHSIPLELKAMLFDTLAAFGAPGGGSIGVDLVHQMWAMLEKMEIIPVRGTPTNTKFQTRIGRAAGGAVVELELVEAAGKTYPATIALVNLLNSLIHTPNKSLTLQKGIEMDSHTIPERLGLGYRFPGLKPYVDFVLDKVFVMVFEREYASQPEQMQVLEACLCFIEKTLASYDLTVLYGAEFLSWKSGNPTSQTKAVNTLSSLATHPGFFVLKRILSSQPIRRNLLYGVHEGFVTMFSHLNSSHSSRKLSIRTLRIVHRVLQIQGIFAEAFVPLLNEAGDLPGLGSMAFPVSSLVPLDLYILQNPTVVPHIAMYVTVPDGDLPLFSVKVIADLSESPYFHATHDGAARSTDALVASLRSSDLKDQILSGFVRWIRMDTEDEHDPSDEELRAVASEEEDTPAPATQAIRLSILDMLLQNTKLSRIAPNVAHLLLGLNASGPGVDAVVEDPLTTPQVSSCLHAILELLGKGVPTPSSNEVVAGALLFQTHPTFAEKCYQLVYQLCSHPFTSSPVIRYLRTREHFFVRQLAVLPTKVPSLRNGIVGRVVYADGSIVETTCGALTSFLRMRSFVLQCVALEIHVLTETGHAVRAQRLVEAYFGTTDAAEDSVHSIYGDLAPGPTVGQKLIRVLEFLESLSVEWVDSLVPSDIMLRLFSDVDWNSCLRTDEHGCQIYDFRPLVSTLGGARRQLQKQGSLSASGAQRQLQVETKHVLQTAGLENHRRAVEHALSGGFTAWSMLLGVAMLKTFDRIPEERGEAILYDILQVLPQYIMAHIFSQTIAIALSTSLLTVITKLRETLQRRRLLLLSTSQIFPASVPADRLHALFKNLLECVLQQGTTERIRGNLYASLINYLRIVYESDDHISIQGPLKSSQTSRGKPSILLAGSLSIVHVVADRLVPIICRDAIDGTEVWKTVAFTLLEGLVRLERNDRPQRVLAALAKDGYVQTFTQSLREISADLQQVLQPDPPSLNALYVYEAKMSLLIRISQSQEGSNRLVEARIFTCLAQCEVLGARPNVDVDAYEQDVFLPSVVERYKQIMIPALELVVSCLSAIGPSVNPVTKQALDFVFAHRETIVSSISEQASPITLTTLREYHLIIALSSLVLSQIKEADLADPVSFKPVHAAVLSLGAKCLNRQRWDPAVYVDEASKDSPNPAFSSTLSYLMTRIQRWFIIYLGSFVDHRKTFKPTLTFDASHALSIHSSHSQTPSKAPTVSDAVAALHLLIQEVANALLQHQDLGSRLGSIDRVSPEEIEEIISTTTTNHPFDLDLVQKRSVAVHQLQDVIGNQSVLIMENLHSIDLLLLIIWHHLNFFLEAEDMTTSWSSSINNIQIPRISLREFTAEELTSALRILSDLKLENLLTHDAAVSRRAYFELFSRKIKELVTRDGEWEVVMA